MKKIINRTVSVLLTAALMLCLYPAVFADNSGDFDFEGILGEESGYNYDRFDKAWTYYAATGIYISKDYFIEIGIKTFSEDYGPNPIETALNVTITNDYISDFFEIESVDFLIGQDIYSFKTLEFMDPCYYVAVLGPRAQWFTEAIASADLKDIAIRVTANGTNYDYEASDYIGFEYFQHGCEVFNEYFAEYYNNISWIDFYEKTYPVTINGKLVEPYNK